MGFLLNEQVEFSYWEVFKYAVDGDVFEIKYSPNSHFIGKRSYMKNHGELGLVMLGEDAPVSPRNLVMASGGITGATFVRVPMYDEIDGLEALRLVKEGNVIYHKESTGYMAVNMFTDFLEMNITDFDDLLDAKFYIKK